MSLPSSLTPLFSTGSSAAGGYQIERSLRFNSADSAFLSRTPAVAGDRKKWTWAAWAKRSSTTQSKLFYIQTGSAQGGIEWLNTDEIRYFNYGGNYGIVKTTGVFRDFSAWYHIVVALDAANTSLKIYVNGVEQALTVAAPIINENHNINSTVEHNIGKEPTASEYFNGYLADIHFISGQALDATAFTEVSATTGQLIPKAYSGSYGTNGFKLNFSDNSTTAALGTDTSGNGNTWTVNNIAPSDGTTYSNNISLSSGSYASGREPAKGFDGLLTTACQGSTNGTSITLSSLAGLTVSTSIEFYSSFGTPGDNTFTINGSASATMAATNQWTSVSFTGTIASAVISSSAQNPTFSAIRIDGAILVDGAAGDSLVDTPTSYGTDTSGVGGEVRGNYATFNPLANKLQNVGTTVTLSNGNLDIVGAANNSSSCAGTFGVSSGKWYFEYTVVAQAETNDTFGFGIRRDLFTGTYDNWEPYFRGTRLRGGDNGFYVAESGGDFSTITSNGTVVGIAFDIDTNYCAVYVNGTIRKSSSSAGLSGYTWFPYVAGDGGGAVTVNFGQRPFAYQTPGTNRPAATFLALCDTNLPSPLIAKPNQHFDAITYTGNGSTLTIPNANSTPTSIAFDPGFIWFKQRASPKRDHNVYDVIRGTTKLLSTNGTSADASTYDVYPGDGSEQTVSGLTAFNTGSKTVDVGSSNVANGSSSSYVAWAWYAGATTDPSNQAGSITSTVRANASAGFSVVTYTGNGTAGATIGHGLGVNPSFVIVKSRSGSGSSYYWICYHGSLGATKALELNSTTAAFISPGAWNNTEPTSSVFSVASNAVNNGSGSTYVAYCFAPVVGYSSFGSYTGNGSTDGPFIFTSFRPRWLLIKRYDSAGNWVLIDTARSKYNPATTEQLFPHLSDAEYSNSAESLDILSNGFKPRSATSGHHNYSGYQYLYIAFAENPFKYSRAR